MSVLKKRISDIQIVEDSSLKLDNAKSTISFEGGLNF